MIGRFILGRGYCATITFTPAEWDPIYKKISAQQPRSVMLIRSAMKRTLGFVIREHTDPADQYKKTICLDFYDESAASMFRLAYL